MGTKKLPELEPGIKLCTQIEPDVSEEFLLFLEQIGVNYVYAWFTPEQFTRDFLSRLRDRVNAHGITLYNVGAVHMAKSRPIILGGPDRDQEIEAFNESLRMLSQVGIHTTTFVWEPDGVWASDWDYPTRGGALTRRCDLRVLAGESRDAAARYTQVPIDGEAFAKTGLTHGRVYSLDEMWENYTYFISRVVPAAEEYGVRLALHPNDPPVDSVGGVACLIKSYNDYKRAFAIAGSPWVGMEFCCGCYLEAAETFGNIYEAIDTFVEERRVFLVHLRNVDARLPCFTETFIDQGYGDLLGIMQAFMRAGYNGTLVMDHSPRMTAAAGKYGECAYANGYIKALMNCAAQTL